MVSRDIIVCFRNCLRRDHVMLPAGYQCICSNRSQRWYNAVTCQTGGHYEIVGKNQIACVCKSGHSIILCMLIHSSLSCATLLPFGIWHFTVYNISSAHRRIAASFPRPTSARRPVMTGRDRCAAGPAAPCRVDQSRSFSRLRPSPRAHARTSTTAI